jgi:hypothetical protein
METSEDAGSHTENGGVARWNASVVAPGYFEGLYTSDMHQNSQFAEPYGLAEDGDGNPK